MATIPLLPGSPQPGCPPDLQPTAEFHGCRGFLGGSQPQALPRLGGKGTDDAKRAAGRPRARKGVGLLQKSTRPLTPALLAETRPLLTLAAQVPD